MTLVRSVTVNVTLCGSDWAPTFERPSRTRCEPGWSGSRVLVIAGVSGKFSGLKRASERHGGSAAEAVAATAPVATATKHATTVLRRGARFMTQRTYSA